MTGLANGPQKGSRKIPRRTRTIATRMVLAARYENFDDTFPNTLIIAALCELSVAVYGSAENDS